MTLDEAINKAVNNMVNYKPWEVEALYIAIKALEQAMWIPVNEELPEEHKEVLTCGLGGYIEIQSFEDSYGGYWENQKGDWSDLDEIIAWMPLPEPYKESEE